MKKIDIIIPAYNEEEALPFLFERLEKIMEEKSGLSNKEEMQQLIHDTVVMAHQELKA